MIAEKNFQYIAFLYGNRRNRLKMLDKIITKSEPKILVNNNMFLFSESDYFSYDRGEIFSHGS